MLGVACAVWLGASGAWLAHAETLDRILAIVAGHVIMHSDVRAVVDLQLAGPGAGSAPHREDEVLDYLIERRLILDEVDRYVVRDPPSADIERRLAAVAARFAEAELATVLARVGYTADDLRQVLRDDARRDAYVETRFGPLSSPTEEQLRLHYEEHLDELAAGGRRPSFAEVRPLVRQRVERESRAASVAAWVAQLVGRGQILRVPPPEPVPPRGASR